MTEFDIDQFVDRTHFRFTHYLTFFVCVLICFIDGFDLVLLGKIAPAIAKDFGESSAAMTPVFVYQQVGLAFGAFVVSPLADRVGRRSMLIFCCIFLGAIMLASMYAQSLHMLAIMRGIAGIFMATGLTDGNGADFGDSSFKSSINTRRHCAWRVLGRQCWQRFCRRLAP